MVHGEEPTEGLASEAVVAEDNNAEQSHLLNSTDTSRSGFRRNCGSFSTQKDVMGEWHWYAGTLAEADLAIMDAEEGASPNGFSESECDSHETQLLATLKFLRRHVCGVPAAVHCIRIWAVH